MRACPRKGEVIGEGNLRTSHGFSILEKLHSCINALIERWFPSPKDLHVLNPKRFLNASFACRMLHQPCDSHCTLKPALASPSAVGGQNVPDPCESRCTLKFTLALCRLCRRKEPSLLKGEYIKKARGRKSPAGVNV